MKELIEIQSELKSPKNLYNSFGKYNYRSCESILESVKPLLKEHNCLLTLIDEIVVLGERYYIKAIATIENTEGKKVCTSAYAREAVNKTGMDEAQITGAASSYARKYALNGLFAIDDTKDADATNMHGKEPKSSKFNQTIQTKLWSIRTKEELGEYYNKIKDKFYGEEKVKLNKAIAAKKEEIEKETI